VRSRASIASNPLQLGGDLFTKGAADKTPEAQLLFWTQNVVPVLPICLSLAMLRFPCALQMMQEAVARVAPRRLWIYVILGNADGIALVPMMKARR
jgi:hypothetical protein